MLYEVITYELEFTWDNKSEPKPGQFLTINPNGVPLLRRPFAFSSYQSGKAAIIYKKIGMATKGFSVLREGDTIDVLGPLGNPFTLPEKRPLLIAGGIRITSYNVCYTKLLRRKSFFYPVGVSYSGGMD